MANALKPQFSEKRFLDLGKVTSQHILKWDNAAVLQR